MDKFKALVHFVIEECDPKQLGAVRLNKILWFSDVMAYRTTGETISGTKYVKRPRGPVPAAVVKTLEDLKTEGRISGRGAVERYDVREFSSLSNADTNLFSNVEMTIVKNIAKDICNNYTAGEISDLSHDVVWEAAAEGEEIPMCATLVSFTGDYRSDVTAWADKVVCNRMVC